MWFNDNRLWNFYTKYFFVSYGFDLEKLEVLHFIAYIAIIFLGGVQSYIFLMISMLLIDMTIFTTALYAYLSNETKNVDDSTSFKFFIKRHIRLLELSGDLRKVCSPFLFMYRISFTVLTCLLCNDIIMVSYHFM